MLDARDHKLGRSVAMKVMLRRQASEEEEQRFLQEARVLGQLAHPNIVPVHDVGKDEQGRFFYTMKLVQGMTLQEVIGRLKAGDKEMLAKYPLTTLLTVFQKVCDAVGFAHSRGIIHRDLKPHNIMVGEFGEVLVMDWGLAKILPGSPAAEEAARAQVWAGAGVRHFEGGSDWGQPERWSGVRGNRVRRRSDIAIGRGSRRGRRGDETDGGRGAGFGCDAGERCSQGGRGGGRCDASVVGDCARGGIKRQLCDAGRGGDGDAAAHVAGAG